MPRMGLRSKAKATIKGSNELLQFESYLPSFRIFSITVAGQFTLPTRLNNGNCKPRLKHASTKKRNRAKANAVDYVGVTGEGEAGRTR